MIRAIVQSGWHQVAFRRDVSAGLTPATIGSRRLMLADREGRLRAYDATCPHRGAHLAYGGSLDGDVVVCPFHGRRIGLGAGAPAPLCVAEHPTVDYAGGVFVLPDGHHDTGLTGFLDELAATHTFVPAFSLDAPVPPEVVIENVFDADHFTTVHGINRRPTLDVSPGPDGGLQIRAVFETVAARPWGGEATATATAVRTRFLARVFSPALVATELGDADRPQVVMTAATARPEGGCTVRVTLAVWDGGGEPPEQATIMSLARDSRLAFQQDTEIWRHLDVEAANHLDEADAAVTEFRRFCRTFAA